jgi:peptidoglycan/LPS O-acetylase OafA/YrhL
MEQKTNSFHLDSIDFLRAIGAIAVCIFHFAHNFLAESNPVYWVFDHGHLGVELFFVMTGFLIPYSLHKKNYNINGFGKYIFDRLLRIHPAYLGAVALCIICRWIVALLPEPYGMPANVYFLDIIGHFTYIQPYIGRNWFVILFWTLAVQFQFYLAYGVFYYFIVHQNKIVRLLSLVLLMALPFWIGKGEIVYSLGKVDYNNFLPHYMHIFLAGILIFLRGEKLISNLEYWVLLLLDCYLLFYWYGSMEAWYGGDYWRPSAVLFASVFIQFINVKHRVFEFLGKTSYALYLIHLPIGWGILSMVKNVLHIDNQYIMTFVVFSTTCLCLYFAYLYWRFVEVPFTSWVRKVLT